MDKIWFISIDGKKDGPWSFEDLKTDNRITPDTLVWKEGFETWKKIREVSELKALFEENSNEPANENEKDASETSETSLGQNELILDMRQDPPYFFWLLLVLLTLLYVMIRLYLRVQI